MHLNMMGQLGDDGQLLNVISYFAKKTNGAPDADNYKRPTAKRVDWISDLELETLIHLNEFTVAVVTASIAPSVQRFLVISNKEENHGT